MKYRYELSKPPSANRIWRHGKGRVYRSPEYLSWKEYNSYRVCPVPKLLEGDIKVSIWLRPKDGRVMDCDNAIKPTIDLLETCQVFRNDGQVVEIRAYKMKPNGKVYDLLVEVEEL